MSEEIVLLEVDSDGVAHVTLNRPEVHNAFDEHVIARLSEIWDALAVNDAVKAVVLRGKGKSFSAGADLGWMKRAADFSEAQNTDDALKLATMLKKFYELPKLTIAVVLGAAMGGGLGLVSCADVVIADEGAKFALSEVKIGLIPATISPYVIRAMGQRHAKRYFQTGERFDGKRGYEIGLVHEYAERPEDVEYLIGQVLKNVKGNGPKAMAASKQLFLDVEGREITDPLLIETAKRIAQTRAGDEAKEGLDAFLNKRKPSWIQE